ncbi:IPExxxVDY family protein [Lutibacter sp.]|uniref:IPExxxVDY family protein n=1 Tax=Lutibacter sp. TaxID=1925666 RepID=UPI00356AE5DB
MPILTFDFEDDYSLIGIHSTEEDYKLAFLINKHIKTKFKRFNFNLDFEGSNAEFPLFEYKDEHNFINYYLINNKHTQYVNNNKNGGLFDGNYSTTSYLIPEKKKVDFFLKIEGGDHENYIATTLEKLKQINQIITSYSIELNSLKNKDYLIF